MRVAALRAIAGSDILAAPVVGMTHGVMMMACAALILVYVTATVVSGASRSGRAPSAGPVR